MTRFLFFLSLVRMALPAPTAGPQAVRLACAVPYHNIRIFSYPRLLGLNLVVPGSIAIRLTGRA